MVSNSKIPLSPSCHPWRATLAGAVTVGLIMTAGCQKPPTPTPTGSPTPAATSSPIASQAPSFAELTLQYEAPAEDAINGRPIIEPLLAGTADDSPSQRLDELDLSQPADLAEFDQKILPLVKEASAKPLFVSVHPLLSGRDRLDYRALRRIVELTTERADLYQQAGKKEQATELVGYPLALAKSMQSRPETVSVNLFSSSYANYSLATIAEWSSGNELNEPQLSEIAKLLAANRPDYEHLRLSISVDFAQLENSLRDPDTQAQLGISIAKPEQVEVWTKELSGLHDLAIGLYSYEPTDPKTFNDAILKAAAQIQGLVIDYPTVSTMQKQAYASYLAAELALTLERHRLSGEKAPLTAEQLLSQTFAQDKTAIAAAEGLLEYHQGATAEAFDIVGRGKTFDLVSPETPIVFYQRR